MNSGDLMKSFNYIDPALIERSEKRKDPARTVRRIAAVAAALLLIFGAAFGVAKAAGTGNTPVVPKDAVLPPSQVGGSHEGITVTTDFLYNKFYSLREIYEEADAVALVTIGDWKGENDVGTYFEAKVDKLYKGDLPEMILVYQMGNSDSVVDGSPLYTYGDRILVGLKPWNREPEFGNSYEGVGSDIGFLYAAESNGETYLIDHKGILSHTTAEECGQDRFTDHAGDKTLVSSLINDLRAYDKALADQLSNGGIRFIYSLAEVEAYFEEI